MARGIETKRAEAAVGGAGGTGLPQFGALSFARSARCLQDAARAAGLVVPAFRSPPRRSDVDRTIRRLPGGAVIAVRVRDRSATSIQADMVEGVIAMNRLTGAAAKNMRALLVRALAQVVPVAELSEAA